MEHVSTVSSALCPIRSLLDRIRLVVLSTLLRLQALCLAQIGRSKALDSDFASFMFTSSRG